MATYIDDERFRARGRADDSLARTNVNRIEPNRDLDGGKRVLCKSDHEERILQVSLDPVPLWKLPCHQY